MEEVVGFVFHLDVQVDPVAPPAAQVGVVAGADGRAVQIGSRANGSQETDGANGHRHLTETGPDPDGPGVEVTEVEEELVPEDAGSDAELEPAGARPQIRAKGLEPQARRRMTYSAPDESGEAAATNGTDGSNGATPKSDDPYAGVGRNSPCPCGSGKKFKMCHGRS